MPTSQDAKNFKLFSGKNEWMTDKIKITEVVLLLVQNDSLPYAIISAVSLENYFKRYHQHYKADLVIITK